MYTLLFCGGSEVGGHSLERDVCQHVKGSLAAVDIATQITYHVYSLSRHTNEGLTMTYFIPAL